jgi:hypothetical protein
VANPVNPEGELTTQEHKSAEVNEETAQEQTPEKLTISTVPEEETKAGQVKGFEETVGVVTTGTVANTDEDESEQEQETGKESGEDSEDDSEDEDNGIGDSINHIIDYMSSKISENVSEDLMKILNPSHSNSKNLQSDIAVAVAAKQQVHNLTEEVVKDKDTEEPISDKVSKDLDKEQSNIATNTIIENNDNNEQSSPQEGGVNKKTKKRMRSGSRSTRGRKTFTQKVYSE